MRLALVLLVAVVVCGCASHGNVSVNAGSGGIAPPAAGGAVSSGQVEIGVQHGSTVGVLAALGGIVYAWHNGWGTESGRYRERPGVASVRIPPLDETRRVREQDCTKPIEDWTANLKCK